jgi:hypothetical protein
MAGLVEGRHGLTNLGYRNWRESSFRAEKVAKQQNLAKTGNLWYVFSLGGNKSRRRRANPTQPRTLSAGPRDRKIFFTPNGHNPLKRLISKK